MATCDNRQDAAGLIQAKLDRDLWRVQIARDQADAWGVADALSDFIAAAMRPLDEDRRSVVVESIRTGGADYDADP
jgi:hypothetical protein